MLFADRARLMIRARKVTGALVLLLVLVSVVWYLLCKPDPTLFAALGYPGVAIAMFLSSSTVFLPAPGFAAVLWAGTVWDPAGVGIVAGLGAATGDLSGYLPGAGGSALLDFKQGKQWERARRLFARYGLWAILLLAVVPNPLFDAMGIVAGSLSYSVRRFWLACATGKIIKFLAMAYLADSALGWWLGR